MSVLVCFVECLWHHKIDTGYVFIISLIFSSFFFILLLSVSDASYGFFFPPWIFLFFGFALLLDKKLLFLMENSNG